MIPAEYCRRALGVVLVAVCVASGCGGEQRFDSAQAWEQCRRQLEARGMGGADLPADVGTVVNLEDYVEGSWYVFDVRGFRCRVERRDGELRVTTSE